MKNKISLDKGVKSILIILIVYACVILVVFLPNYFKKQKDNLFIMTSRYKIKYEKGKWQKIVNGDDYKLKQFDIYQDNNYLGNYKIMFSSTFTLIDDNEKIADYNGYILAKRGNIKTKIYNFISNNDYTYKDQEIIINALKEVNIDSNAYFNIHQKIVLDNITIYFADNIPDADDYSLDGITEPIENSSGKNFSLLVLYKDNKVYVIDSIITSKTDFEIFEVQNIIDINEDNDLELIYLRGDRYNSYSDCAKLYDLAKNKEIHNFCE